MKQVPVLLFFLLAISPCMAQETETTPRSEPVRYSYNVSGIVFSEKSRPLPKITVCFLTAVRPSDARVPCVKTDEKGNFSVGSYNIPDKYEVCASTGDLPFVPLGDKKTHIVCSQSLTFNAADESKQVNLKFGKARHK